MSAQQTAVRQVIEAHSKSFALAARLLPPSCRDDARALYAWCRRADDAVDLAPATEATLSRLDRELDAAYAGKTIGDPIVDTFGEVVRRRGVPSVYPRELLAGMAMDARGTRYETIDALMPYCYRVAGTVGLMMAHLMGARDHESLPRAAQLGMAMQLTNICRDVEEDERRGRVYLPATLVGRGDRRRAMRMLLAEADALYRSAEAGLAALPFRCAIAIRAARLIYAAIGREIARRGCDPTAGRAVVPTTTKLLLLLRAVAGELRALPRRLVSRTRPTHPLPEVRYSHDIAAV